LSEDVDPAFDDPDDPGPDEFPTHAVEDPDEEVEVQQRNARPEDFPPADFQEDDWEEYAQRGDAGGAQ
jgi:hypothetical protein